MDKVDMLTSGCALLLVSPGLFFFTVTQELEVKELFILVIFVKLSYDQLKTCKVFENGFYSENGFVSYFIDFSVIVFDTYAHLNLKRECHSIVETVDAPKISESNVATPNVKNQINIYRDSNNIARYDNKFIVKAIEVPKTFKVNIFFPMTKNRSYINSDFNIVSQGDNQFLCFGVIPGQKKRLLKYIKTINANIKITLNLPQILALQTITPLIVDS